MLKAFDSYKAVLLSANLSSKEFQKADSTEFKELQNRLRKVNLHWEKANRALDSWRKGLQQALLHCQVHPTCQLVREIFGILLRRGQRGNSCTSVEWSLTIQGTLFQDKVASDGLKWFGKNIFEMDNALYLHRWNTLTKFLYPH